MQAFPLSPTPTLVTTQTTAHQQESIHLLSWRCDPTRDGVLGYVYPSPASHVTLFFLSLSGVGGFSPLPRYYYHFARVASSPRQGSSCGPLRAMHTQRALAT